jgi:hypothetical protein
MDLILMAQLLLSGAIAGAIWGIVGYIRNKEEDDLFESFDLDIIAPTIIGSAFIGAYAYASGLTLDVASASVYGVVLTQIARKIWNVFLIELEKKTKR